MNAPRAPRRSPLAGDAFKAGNRDSGFGIRKSPQQRAESIARERAPTGAGGAAHADWRGS
jgi:hypothetical protein